MSAQQLKQPLFIAYMLFAMACFFASCTKRNVKPTNTNYNQGGIGNQTGIDTTTSDSGASFNAPTGIAVDGSGNIYVADYGNNLIRKISATGIVNTIAGNGNQGSINGAGNAATFNGPTSVAVDASGNIYVADENNNQIRKIGTDGMVSTLAGSDSTGAVDGLGADAYFFAPSGVAVDAQNNIYVADGGNNLIREITPAGQVTTLAGSVNPGSANGAALSSTFYNPSGLAVSAQGIYVADMLNGLIRKITGGTVSTLAGSDTTASIDGTGTAAAFYFPNSVAVDAGGNVYVTEYVNNLIRKITPDGVVTTFAGNGTAGQADGTGTNATFNGPSGIAVDAAGNVYVADTYNNVIRKITPGGVVSTIAGNGSAGASNGKAVAVARGRIINAAHRANGVNNTALFKIFAKRHAANNFLRGR